MKMKNKDAILRLYAISILMILLISECALNINDNEPSDNNEAMKNIIVLDKSIKYFDIEKTQVKEYSSCEWIEKNGLPLINKYTSYNGSGPDFDWFSNDDFLKTETRYEYYDNDLLKYRIIYELDENNNKEIGYYFFYEYEESKKSKVTKYDGTGDNGVWFNNDNIVYEKVFQYYPDGNIKYEIIYKPVSIIYSYIQNVYNTDGKITERYYYKDSGDNGGWLDTDDNKTSYIKWDYSDGNLWKVSSYRKVNAAGEFILDSSSEYYYEFDVNNPTQTIVTMVMELPVYDDKYIYEYTKELVPKDTIIYSCAGDEAFLISGGLYLKESFTKQTDEFNTEILIDVTLNSYLEFNLR